LRSVDECVDVVEQSEFSDGKIPALVDAYASRHPFGQKLAVILSLPINGPTVYCDSDVLFFPGAGEAFGDLLASTDQRPRYLQDCVSAFDSRLLRSEREADRAANAGFIMLYRPLDWSVGLGRLRTLEGSPGFFSEQTVVHLALHANDAQPLDATRYVLALDDQFDWRDRHCGNGMCMRHYVRPVRHKMWLRVQQEEARFAARSGIAADQFG
jgi:hypothetical protein